MVRAEFRKHADAYQGFCISGHAGYAEHGQDIVCAGVSSAIQLTVNGICEILNASAEVTVHEDEIALMLSGGNVNGAVHFIEALRLHMSLLSEDYPQMIQLTDVEV